MNGLTFPGETLNHLRDELLVAAPNEAAAILLAGQAVTNGHTRLLVRERHVVPESGYTVQEPYRVVLPPLFLMPLLKRARNEGWSLILTHTHPFGDQAHFSIVDDDGESLTMPALFSRTTNKSHGSLVLARKDCAARIYKSVSGSLSRDSVPVSEVGHRVRTHWPAGAKSKEFATRFDRSVRAFGTDGQTTLSGMTVGIVGLGGLGSIVAEQLAYLGVGSFVLLDPDVIDETNLNRVVGSTNERVGVPKTSSANQMIHTIRREASVRAVSGDVMHSVDAHSLLGVDFLFGCTDSHGSRTVINQIAYQYMIPTIDLGVRVQAKDGIVESIVGRVQMLAPGLACLVCTDLLDPEEVRRDFLSADARRRDPYIPGAAEVQPSVISLNGTVASLGVTMMLSAMVGLPVAARHQIVRFDRGVVRSVTQEPQPDCIVCSTRGALGRGDSWPLPTRSC